MAESVKQRVEVCYALPGVSFLVQLDVDSGTTIAEAITASGVLARFPEIDLAHNKLGVFGKLKPADTVLRDGDRIEIYRPLQADPMESRRRRARHKAAARG
jgi:putative ubiquitin-RnfH superfamily antitoxin RatB of RatAB toxin-antitoxin module